jgi:hypothetical protein
VENEKFSNFIKQREEWTTFCSFDMTKEFEVVTVGKMSTTCIIRTYLMLSTMINIDPTEHGFMRTFLSFRRTGCQFNESHLLI